MKLWFFYNIVVNQVCTQSCLGKYSNAIEMVFSISCNRRDLSVSINSNEFAKSRVILNYWFGLLFKYFQTLDYRLLIVIWSSTGLSSFNKPSFQFSLFAIEVDHGFEIDWRCHDFFPHVHVLLTSRETVEKVPSSIIISLYFFFDDSHH